jgi:4-hydroxybenzoate polyprenyltransferase
MIVLLFVLGVKLQLDWPWFAGVAVAAGLFAWQQKLVLGREREACFKAFLNNNWVGVAILAGLIAAYTIA